MLDHAGYTHVLLDLRPDIARSVHMRTSVLLKTIGQYVCIAVRFSRRVSFRFLWPARDQTRHFAAHPVDKKVRCRLRIIRSDRYLSLEAFEFAIETVVVSHLGLAVHTQLGVAGSR